MKKKRELLVLGLPIAVAASSVLAGGAVTLNASELTDFDVNAYEQSVTSEATSNTRDSKLIAGSSEIGNQNTSAIGKNTFVGGDESTEDSFKTLKQLSNSNDKFYAVEDLGTNLVKEVTSNVDVKESIRPMSEAQAAQLGYTQTITFNGSGWEDVTSNSATYTGTTDDGSSSITITNYGLYYSFDSLDYAPVDLTITIDYLDYWNTTALGKGLVFKYNDGNITLTNYYTDEIQLSTHYTRTDNGESVDVPIIYNIADIDSSLSLGFDEDDVLGYGAYYVDPTDAANASLGDYVAENDVPSDGTAGLPTWDYESYFNYVMSIYGGGATHYHEGDRSDSYAGTALSGASGNFEPAERGWNRLKYIEKNGYITIQDTWGSNSNGYYGNGSNTASMTTDGKESKFTMVLNSNFTFTMNLSNALMNVPVTAKGGAQAISLKPYAFERSTLIHKDITDANDDGVVQNGESIEYTIDVVNPDPFSSVSDVEVRDSMLETTPDYLTYNSDLAVSGSTLDGDTFDVSTTGDITEGNLVVESMPASSVVELTYSMDASDALSRFSDEEISVDNTATDDGSNPKQVCTEALELIECDATVTPVQQDPTISKSVADENGDDLFSVGETLTYTIHVDNPNATSVTKIPVRDSMLESEIPEYFELGDVTVTGNVFDVESTGDLTTGDYMIEEIPGSSSVDISYTLTMLQTPPNDVMQSITNIATDNGEDPNVCEDLDKTKDCDETITIIEPETLINKSVTDENGDGIVSPGETLNYVITVNNDSKISSYDVAVRDSLLEELPEYLTIVSEPVVAGSKTEVTYTGSLLTGDMVIDEVEGKSNVTISYSLKLADDFSEDVNVVNIVTDNGDDPTACENEASSDCDVTTTPVEGDTVIEKTVEVTHNEDEATSSKVSSEVASEDATSEADVELSDVEIVHEGDDLVYTIAVTNIDPDTPALNVVIRDNMFEVNMNSVDVDPTSVTVTDADGNEIPHTIEGTTLTISSIDGGGVAYVKYNATVSKDALASEIITNIATDNDQDPSICYEANLGVDCSQVDVAMPDADLTEITNVTEVTEVTEVTNVTNNYNSEIVSETPASDPVEDEVPEYTMPATGASTSIFTKLLDLFRS